jgi:hypothetical protein
MPLVRNFRKINQLYPILKKRAEQVANVIARRKRDSFASLQTDFRFHSCQNYLADGWSACWSIQRLGIISCMVD